MFVLISNVANELTMVVYVLESSTKFMPSDYIYSAIVLKYDSGTSIRQTDNLSSNWHMSFAVLNTLITFVHT